MSNLAVGLAVPEYDAGKKIEVRLGSVTGQVIGVVTTRMTSVDLNGWDEWCVFSEQHLPLVTNLWGTQTVYFVGRSTGGNIANLYRFRFYGDAEKTRGLVQEFRDNYFTTNDLDRLWALGYNCLRVPFFYRLLEDDISPYQYKASGWARLDWLLEECRKRRMWVILDLHGAPGGVNPWHSSGEQIPFRNRMWKVEHYKDRTEKLWGEIAARYATNPVVAGYDLINEPAPYVYSTLTAQKVFSNDVLPVLDRLYQAVRSNDTQHIVIMEGNMLYTNQWEDAQWWPTPASRGWSNVVYEFHAYDNIVWGPYDGSFTNQKAVCDRNVRGLQRVREDKKVPVYLGEFQPEDPQNHDYAYRRYTAEGISWGHWNWRTWGWMDPSRTNRGWTGWGLEYRSAESKGEAPNLREDDYATLSNRFALYTGSNYEDHAYLQQVVRNDVATDAVSYCEFYLNTFSSPKGDYLGDGWPWEKIEGIGDTNAFAIKNKQAKLQLNYGAAVMRWKTRSEVDAHFRVNDATGTWFEVRAVSFYVTNQAAGAEAEVRLAVVRDEITNAVKEYDGPAVIARMEYDVDSGETNVNLYLYGKTNGVNTYGTELYHTNGLAFGTNGTLRLHVDSNTVSLVYNGTEYFVDGVHGVDMGEWPHGGVCVVEAEDTGGHTEFIYLDDFKAWREGAEAVESYEGTYTNAPDGMMLRAWMGDAAVRRTWSSARDTSTYVTNGRVVLIPGDSAGDSAWLNARKDFENELRLEVATGRVAEVRVGVRDFTQGYAKVGLLPEYFPGRLYDDWNGTALYLEMSRSGGNINFTAYRTYGTKTYRWALTNSVSVAYDDNSDVTVQVSSNWFKAYYGTNVVVDAGHGIGDFAGVYPNGLHVHVEFQSSQAQGYMGLEGLKCRIRDGFGLEE